MVPVPTLHRDSRAHPENCAKYITVKNRKAYLKIYKKKKNDKKGRFKTPQMKKDQLKKTFTNADWIFKGLLNEFH